ncbi:hypothetical protein C0Q70_11113 [Pomacea canaliculata]|uniref:Uncharacterized protein n=1 Tax=Pomacea canaliculata TaxID=400727 RepID=A0A2T7P518_POMCA|nr:hypothetical protein C0Q70_11113 [Pomacea canaliculata]
MVQMDIRGQNLHTPMLDVYQSTLANRTGTQQLDFETATLRVTHHVIATPPRGKGLVLTIDPGCRNLLWQLRSGGCSYKGMRPCDHVLLTRTAWPTLGRSCHPPLEADRYCLRSRLNFDLHERSG